MKNIVKMMALLFSVSLLAEKVPTEHIPVKTKSEDLSSQTQTLEKIYGQENIKDDQYEEILKEKERKKMVVVPILGIATIGINTVLHYLSVLAHEYGHALPSIIARKDYNVEVISTGDLFFPFCGRCFIPGTLTSPFITILLGPVTGVFTTYLQCTIIKALHDSLLQNKPFSECFKQALKFPITFFNNAIKMGKKYWSYMIEEKAWPHNTEEKMPTTPERTSISFAVNTILFTRIMYMIIESIYGFLPYKPSGEIEGDGKRIWHMLLGSQSPTFNVNLGIAAFAVMSAPFIMGAIKAEKKYTFDRLVEKAKNMLQSHQTAKIS